MLSSYFPTERPTRLYPEAVEFSLEKQEITDATNVLIEPQAVLMDRFRRKLC